MPPKLIFKVIVKSACHGKRKCTDIPRKYVEYPASLVDPHIVCRNPLMRLATQRRMMCSMVHSEWSPHREGDAQSETKEDRPRHLDFGCLGVRPHRRSNQPKKNTKKVDLRNNPMP